MANKGIDDAIKSYLGSSNERTSKGFNLKKWVALKNKPFSPMDAMRCIFLEADGSFSKVDEILEKILFVFKTHGRSQVHNTIVHGGVDIIYDEKGNLKLTGLEKYKEENPVGQHRRDTGGFNQSGEKGKPRQKTEDLVKDMEKEVIDLYPNEHPQYIYLAMRAIREYAAQKKKTTDYVINLLKKGRIILDDDIWRIKPNVKKESISRPKTIIITEDMANSLKKELEVTEYKFNSNVRKFIANLLQDPVNTKVPDLLSHYFKRSSLLSNLINGGLLVKHERLSDKDENGNPKTVTMMVKYSCPKKDFDRKLKKLFIKLFEKNLPKKELNEDGEAGCDATGDNFSADTDRGSFEEPLFGVIRRKMPSEIDETTATGEGNVGDYEYAVPAPVKKKDPSLKRPRGGICVQRVK